MKLGVIGAGVMGRNHLRTIKAMSDVTLVAVADVAPLGEEAAKEFGCACLPATDFIGKVDAAIIAAPTTLQQDTRNARQKSGQALLQAKAKK